MRVKIEFEVELSDIKHTSEELDEYIKYSFRATSIMSGRNPFDVLGEPDPVFGTFNWQII